MRRRPWQNGPISLRERGCLMNVGINFLQNLFGGFLRARGMSHHFERLGIAHLFKRAEAHKDLPLVLTISLVNAAKSEQAALFADLGTHPDGLTDDQAESVRERVGVNEVEQEKPLPWWRHLWQCYRNPFNLLLTALAAISFYTEDLKATIVIGS